VLVDDGTSSRPETFVKVPNPTHGQRKHIIPSAKPTPAATIMPHKDVER